MLGFPWAKALVGTAQQLALHFSTDKVAVDILAAEAAKLGLTVHLSPCNLSQVQSVHACLQSLLRLQAPIKQALLEYPVTIGYFEVGGVAVANPTHACPHLYSSPSPLVAASLLACGHQAATCFLGMSQLHSIHAVGEQNLVSCLDTCGHGFA